MQESTGLLALLPLVGYSVEIIVPSVAILSKVSGTTGISSAVNYREHILAGCLRHLWSANSAHHMAAGVAVTIAERRVVSDMASRDMKWSVFRRTCSANDRKRLI